MPRKTIVLVAATAALSAGATSAAFVIAAPESATAWTDQAVLRELKRINSNLGATYKAGTVIGELYDITNGELKAICRNTLPDGRFAGLLTVTSQTRRWGSHRYGAWPLGRGDVSQR